MAEEQWGKEESREEEERFTREKTTRNVTERNMYISKELTVEELKMVMKNEEKQSTRTR